MKTLSEYLEIPEGLVFRIFDTYYKIENNKLFYLDNEVPMIWKFSLIHLCDLLKYGVEWEEHD